MATARGIFLAAFIAAAAGPAAALNTGPYVGFGGGLYVPRTSHAQLSAAGAAPTTADVDFSKGFGLMGAAGYKWTRNLRTEIELGYRHAGVDTFASTTGNGSQKIFSLMGNAVLEFETANASPYIGAGAGFGRTTWNGVSGTATPVFDDSAGKFQWQAIAGVSTALGARTDIFLDYRYASGGGQFTGMPLGSILAGYDNRSHNILVGIRYSFGAPPAVATAPLPRAATPASSTAPVASSTAPATTSAAPAAPSPTVAPALAPVRGAQNFRVLFDYGSWTVNADGQRILVQAAAAFRQGASTTVQATGHTDTSGAAGFNIILSQQRAFAVQGALIRLGVPESQIIVLWRGEYEPLVPTGDGVKEPQNRRVEIVVQ